MKIVIRCDAYPRLGIGHLMRCLALAEGFGNAGWEVSLLTYCTSKGLLERIRAQGFELHELESPDDTAVALTEIKAESPDWVVLDGYHFDTGFQHDIKGLGPKVLVFDDYHHLDSYECDIIVNQNLGAQSINYRAADNTCVLAGSYYVVLRKDFLDYGERDKRQIPPQGTKLLVTLGGADPDNLTVKVLKGLGHIKRVLHVRVVVGAANLRLEEIKEFARSLHHEVEVLHDVADMQRLMLWADIALTAGGTTSWEIAYMGLPAIFTIIADNQKMGVDALSEAGYPSLGMMQDVLPEGIGRAVEGLLGDSEKRQELSSLGGAIVDGKGIERIMRAMESKPLRVLFLGGEGGNPLADWLRQQGEEVHYTHKKLSGSKVRGIGPDIIVSYNYRHILKKDILDIPPMGAINLHISYLPFNRGADPNPWSFLEGTPTGVTIHYIDEGIDTGDIIYQSEIEMDNENETLESSFNLLHHRIQDIFRENWSNIRKGCAPRVMQKAEGTYHESRESERFRGIISKYGWDIPIARFLEEVTKQWDRR